MINEDDLPLAFFITFRTYGTWLHGDSRGSTSRFRNRHKTPHHAPNENWEKTQRSLLKRNPFKLNRHARTAVRGSIYETCEKRKWRLHAQNVRTNHVHAVVDAGTKKGKAVRAALKANATRALRESGHWRHKFSPWSGKGSVKSIWDLDGLVSVIDYVRNRQGDDI